MSPLIRRAVRHIWTVSEVAGNNRGNCQQSFPQRLVGLALERNAAPMLMRIDRADAPVPRPARGRRGRSFASSARLMATMRKASRPSRRVMMNA